jgi:four helix bundle protein
LVTCEAAGKIIIPPMARFPDLGAWQASQRLAAEVYRVTKDFPPDERYGLTAQVRRAAVSVVANIAEGSAKRGSREFRRYLDISLGSLSELTALLLLASEVGILDAKAAGAIEPVRKRAAFLLWRLYRSMA